MDIIHTCAAAARACKDARALCASPRAPRAPRAARASARHRHHQRTPAAAAPRARARAAFPHFARHAILYYLHCYQAIGLRY